MAHCYAIYYNPTPPSTMDIIYYLPSMHVFCLFVCLMVFNATLNNITVISWWSVLLVEETEEPEENHRPVTSH